MRRSPTLTAIPLLAALVLTTASCDHQTSAALVPAEPQTSTNSCAKGGLVLPAGSKAEKVGGEVRFTLPERFHLAITNADGDVLALPPGGSVTCRCQSRDGGCYPGFIDLPAPYEDIITCFTYADNPCSQCYQTVHDNSTGEKYPLSQYRAEVRFGTPDEYAARSRRVNASYREGFRPVLSFTEMKMLPSATEALLSREDVQATISLFQAVHAPGAKTTSAERTPEGVGHVPAGHNLAPFNVEGHLVYLVVSQEDVDRGYVVGLAAEAGPHNFRCPGCSGRCRLQNPVDRVYYCDGCDSGCTLSWDE